jgi:uncharacterized protein with HEPN domain
MPRDEHYLADLLEAASAIKGFLSGVEKDAFLASDLLQSAVLHKLTIIGEAANRLTPEFRAGHPEVPWRNIVAFRNIIVHAYFTIDWDIAWNAATVRVPELVEQLGADRDK